MIGMIGAMEEEVLGLRRKMSSFRVETRANMDFYIGELEGKECVLVCSGIGKVNAAACAQILADRFEVTCILNTGIAGGLKKELSIGDIVLSTDAVQYDFDCTGCGYPLGKIPRMKTSEFPADPALGALAFRCCREENPGVGVFMGRVASGDCFVSSGGRKTEICECFDAWCCEMEGAAIAQVAYLNELPYLIIRAISDQADGTAPEQYDQFQSEAIEHFLKLTLRLLREM